MKPKSNSKTPVITIVVQNGFCDVPSKPRGVRVTIIDRDTDGDPEEIISMTS